MKTQNTTTFITLWENILTAIKQELTDSNYNTWFGSSKAMWLQDNGTVLVVGVLKEEKWIYKNIWMTHTYFWKNLIKKPGVVVWVS